jgi:AAA family ATP:ADP antiporter
MPAAPAPPETSRLFGLVRVRPREGRSLLLAGGYFFFLLFSFYLLRPVRETMGIARGADKLPWLMTGTMLAMFLANPLHAAIVSRMPRRRFIPWICHFFAANLVIFYGLFRFLPGHGGAALGYAFYVWLSVFNLFVVSVFWGLMADAFDEEQAARLFGIISMGGTLGSLAGAACTESLTRGAWGIQLEPASMLLVSLVSLELAIACMVKLAASLGLPTQGRSSKEPGPRPHEGLKLLASSRYLQLISAYIVLFTITSTFLYLIQGRIVEHTYQGAAERTAAFARIDFWVNVLTLVVQVFLTGHILRGLRVAGVLVAIPLLTLLAFPVLAMWPVFPCLAAVMVLRRGLHYAVDRPAREILYIPLGPEEKYKAKPFVDTFVYRGGDFIGVWTPTLLSLVAIPTTLVAVVLTGAWTAVGMRLGRLRVAPVGQSDTGAS